jgi:archaellum component FlaC
MHKLGRLEVHNENLELTIAEKLEQIEDLKEDCYTLAKELEEVRRRIQEVTKQLDEECEA